MKMETYEEATGIKREIEIFEKAMNYELEQSAFPEKLSYRSSHVRREVNEYIKMKIERQVSYLKKEFDELVDK